MNALIKNLVNESIEVQKKTLENNQIECIDNIIGKIIKTYKDNHKAIICGNGGSASDALHFAAEMVVRFEKNRNALPSIPYPEI
jgi:D-sedoheptulose 7-phosphate isomerase